MDVIQSADIVCDVGCIYDPSKFRFDHHQKGYNDCFNEKHKLVKMAAIGQIYKHFGKRVISILYPNLESDEPTLNFIHEYFYSSYIKERDAVDNGWNVVSSR
jgi:uncharacterized UPF0160 family protein